MKNLGEMETKDTSYSTVRADKDIELTLAEIKERGDRRRFEVASYGRLQNPHQTLQDIDSLLSIIGQLEKERDAAARLNAGDWAAACDAMKEERDRLAFSLNEVATVHEKCYPMLRQALIDKESAASRTKAALVERVRERATRLDSEPQIAGCPNTAASAVFLLARELEAVEITQGIAGAVKCGTCGGELTCLDCVFPDKRIVPERDAESVQVSTESSCPHLHQDFPGTPINKCLDCETSEPDLSCVNENSDQGSDQDSDQGK